MQSCIRHYSNLYLHPHILYPESDVIDPLVITGKKKGFCAVPFKKFHLDFSSIHHDPIDIRSKDHGLQFAEDSMANLTYPFQVPWNT